MLHPSPHPSAAAPAPPLAAVLAGGRSRRFGAPKAPAPVGGVPLARRVVDAVRAAGCTPVLIASDPAPLAWLALPTRPDLVPGGGPLSGIHAALRWAEERALAGALCVACDMPFLHPSLLRALLLRARAGAAVAPASVSRHGCEPLCAWYPVAAIPNIESRLDRGDLALGPLLRELQVEILPLEVVGRFGDPELLFLNVNRPADRLRAEAAARTREPSDAEA